MWFVFLEEQSEAEKQAIIKTQQLINNVLKIIKKISYSVQKKHTTFFYAKSSRWPRPLRKQPSNLEGMLCGWALQMRRWRFLIEFSVSVRLYFVGDERKRCSLSSRTEKSRPDKTGYLADQEISPVLDMPWLRNYWFTASIEFLTVCKVAPHVFSLTCGNWVNSCVKKILMMWT